MEQKQEHDQVQDQLKDQVQEQENEFHILFVLRKDATSKVMQGVKGLDENGNLLTFPLEEAEANEFMQFDKNSSVLKNFFKNFWAKCKDPYNMVFYSGKKEQVEQPLKNVEKIPTLEKDGFIKPLDFEEWLGIKQEQQGANPVKQEVKTEEKKGEQAKEPYFKGEEIPWDKLKLLGIDKDSLERSGDLENMIKGGSSKHMIPVKIDFGDIKIETDVKISLWKNKNKDIIVDMKGSIRQPNLNEYYNVKFEDKDKENLLRTGNLGRVIEVKYPNQVEAVPIFLSIDRLTNRYVPYQAKSLRLPDEFMKVKLDQEIKGKLARGEAVFLTNLENKDGEKFNTFVQVSAETKGIAIMQDRLKSRITKEERQIEDIPFKIGNTPISSKQQEILKDRGYILLPNLELNGKVGDFVIHKPEGKPLQFFDLSDPRNFLKRADVESSEVAYTRKHTSDNVSNCNQKEDTKIAVNQNVNTDLNVNAQVDPSLNVNKQDKKQLKDQKVDKDTENTQSAKPKTIKRKM